MIHLGHNREAKGQGRLFRLWHSRTEPRLHKRNTVLGKECQQPLSTLRRGRLPCFAASGRPSHTVRLGTRWARGAASTEDARVADCMPHGSRCALRPLKTRDARFLQECRHGPG